MVEKASIKNLATFMGPRFMTFSEDGRMFSGGKGDDILRFRLDLQECGGGLGSGTFPKLWYVGSSKCSEE